jgi:hypothetical protein
MGGGTKVALVVTPAALVVVVGELLVSLVGAMMGTTVMGVEAGVWLEAGAGSSAVTGSTTFAPPLGAAAVGVAVSVTVTVGAAAVTVTVTGTQAPPGAPEAAGTPDGTPGDGAAVLETSKTVMYRVEVAVEVRVVVTSSPSAVLVATPGASPPGASPPGRVAVTVSVEYCLIVVVTIVVEVPAPRV